MAAKHTLRDVAFGKLRAAKGMLLQHDWSNAIYLAGLAVECLLKARVCGDRNLAKWPETPKEFSVCGCSPESQPL
jgi:hypothetical protein